MINETLIPVNEFASIWAESTQIGMVAFTRDNGVIYPRKKWTSNIEKFDFGFVDVLENWKAEHGIKNVIVNTSPERDGEQKSTRHPIQDLLGDEMTCRPVPSTEPFMGLIALHHHKKNGTIDHSLFLGEEKPLGEEKIMAQIKQLEIGRNPVAMAYLQGLARWPKPLNPAAKIPRGTRVISSFSDY